MKSVKEYILELRAIDQIDGESYVLAYDKLLWALAVSPLSELQDIVSDLLSGPYKELPIPMQVMIARIVAFKSISIGDKEMFDHADLILSMYGDYEILKQIAIDWPE